jgi:hypothetical protein
VACLPAAVSLLLLEALFMQISGVSLALTWPHRLCLFRVLLCPSLCYMLSPFQALGKVTLLPRCQACVFIYSSCWKWVFPVSCEVFLPPPLSEAFLLLITGWCCCSCLLPCLFTVHVGSGSSLLSCGIFLPLPLSPGFPLLVVGRPSPAPTRASSACRACLFTVLGRIPFPGSSALRAPHPLFRVSLLLLLLITQFLFFPRVEVSLSRGLCCCGPGLSVGVPCYSKAHLVRVFPSHLGTSDWRPGALLVSPFNVKWRFFRRLEVWRGQSYAFSQ